MIIAAPLCDVQSSCHYKRMVTPRTIQTVSHLEIQWRHQRHCLLDGRSIQMIVSSGYHEDMVTEKIFKVLKME